jgi:hypothetical protein
VLLARLLRSNDVASPFNVFLGVHNAACMQRRWKAITAYEDSSTDEEGPDGTSIYWCIPLSHRAEYKPCLRAMRRAHHRRAYLTHLQRLCILTIDVPPSGLTQIKGVPLPSYIQHTQLSIEPHVIEIRSRLFFN